MPRVAVISLLATLAAGPPTWAQTIGLEPPPDLTAPSPDAERTASGLATQVLLPSEGDERPATNDYVSLHFAGWTTDGNLLESSGSTARIFPLDRTLPGFRECVGMMAVGERRRCWVPESLGYQGQPGRPLGPLVFDVELIDTRRAPSVPPEDVGAVPSDAERTDSGLAFKRLRQGSGIRNPSEFSQVQVHYTGWTTDGALFDTSLEDGQTRTFSVSDVVPGWTEGLQMMVEGDQMRFWIPEDLAYMGEPGAPILGMLVFDVELVRIEN